jgi:hypothetical protein
MKSEVRNQRSEKRPNCGCSKCGHLACVCKIIAAHPDPKCDFRFSATCAVPVECKHGYDVCPICDPCTCKPTLVKTAPPCQHFARKP